MRGIEPWLASLPPWLRPAAQWFLSAEVLEVLAVASVVMFVASIIAVPWFVIRLPADYFAEPGGARRWIDQLPRWRRVVVRVLKNLLGALLLVAGLAMLVLPGQGLLTLAAALLLLDLPQKQAIERRLLRWSPVRRAFDALRRRAGRPPLVLPRQPVVQVGNEQRPR